MAQKVIKTSIKIHATAQRVWEELTDFESYPSWNPFITFVKGEPIQGNRLHIKAGGMSFKPTVLISRKGEELRWLGHFLFKGLFDGEHRFVIEDNKDGTVTFRQEESFSGMLVGIFAKKLDTDTVVGFKSMNEKLKERAER